MSDDVRFVVEYYMYESFPTLREDMCQWLENDIRNVVIVKAGIENGIWYYLTVE